MGIARVGAGVGATVLAATVLVGCGSNPDPRPPSDDEISAVLQQQAREWWQSFAGDEPMPKVEVIEVLPPELAHDRQLECVGDAAIPGVMITADGGMSYPENNGGDDPVFEQLQRVYWMCTQQYPSDDVAPQVMSQEQLAWVYDFYVERYRPCLGSFGFEFVGFPGREQFVGDTAGYLPWVPYDQSVLPRPTQQQWELLSARCPLPTLLADLGLPAYQSTD